MSDETEYFQRICRYCLGTIDTTDVTVFLNDMLAKATDSNDANLSYIIEACVESHESIESCPELPQSICEKCSDALRTFSKFLTKCKESLAFLNEMLDNCKNETAAATVDADVPSLVQISVTTPFPTIIGSSLGQDEHPLGIYDSYATDDQTVSSYFISENDPSIASNLTTVEATVTSQHSNAVAHQQDATSADVVSTKSKTKCPDCGALVMNLRKHVETHKDDAGRRKPYVCELCQRAYINRPSYIGHMNKHKNLRPYACGKCDKTFHGASNLRMHMNSHETVRKFRCSDCPKTFRYCHDLAAHRRIHTQHPIHACEHCSYTNVNLQNLRRHALIHNAVHRFKCERCAKGFNRKEYYRNHVQNNRCKQDAEELST